jgi:hypothetical protein
MKINGLSLEQEKAANLIAIGKKVTDKKVAKAVGIKIKTLRSWKEDPKFKLRVMQLFEANIDIERTYRAKRIKNLLVPVYREIKRRFDENVLEDVSFKELLRTMILLHAELRQDGNFNKKWMQMVEPDGNEKSGNVTSSEDNEEDSLAAASKRYTSDRTGDKKVVPIR